ncbi:MAG TPA: SsrA-binding protein SmpB [Bacteroidia bacterium]|jgi:SsrA-binding protein
MAEEKDINIRNKRASFEYSFLEKYVAGIQLTGTEIKSIREGKASIAEAYCIFINGELWVRNMNVNEYAKATHYNHEPKRDRKLLLGKQELKKLSGKLKDQGLAIVPLRMFISESGYAKLEIALAKGKKLYDKREDIKKRDVERETSRKFK